MSATQVDAIEPKRRTRALKPGVELSFAALTRDLPHWVVVKNAASTYLSCNDSFARALGAPAQFLAGKSDRDVFTPESAERSRADDERVMRDRRPIIVEEPDPRGIRHGWVQTTKTPVFDDAGTPIGVMAVYQDITERKREADELHRRGWALAALQRAYQALLHADNERALLHGICAAVTSDNMYPLACIGWADGDSVRMVATAGKGIGYTERLTGTGAEAPFGSAPAVEAVRTGTTTVENDFGATGVVGPWLQQVQGFGLHGLICVPFQTRFGNAGQPRAGVLTVYASIADAFGPEEIALFEELAASLVPAVETRRVRVAYDASLKTQAAHTRQLRQAMEDTLTVIADVVEQRDSYTAGHQRRVADLVVLIGRELGLPEDHLQGLYWAGIVHDLGKIKIPQEILCKPTELTPAEFGLVKEHPTIGYQLLKGISFPWPIAEMVLQHHEFLDGTGYPLGLTAEQIRPESKILTVADIFESISTDRPYHAAEDFEEAIHILTEMSEAKLDRRVVDACIKVVQRGDFQPHLPPTRGPTPALDPRRGGGKRGI